MLIGSVFDYWVEYWFPEGIGIGRHLSGRETHIAAALMGPHIVLIVSCSWNVNRVRLN